MKLLETRLDIRANLELLVGEILVDEATMEQLATNHPHVLIQRAVSLGLLNRAVAEILRANIRLLWHFTRESLRCFRFLFLLLRALLLNTRHKTHPDFAISDAFDKTDIVLVCSTLFDADPLLRSNVVLLRLVMLIDRGHLIRW